MKKLLLAALLLPLTAFADENVNVPHVVRLDFNVVESEAGKPASTGTYAMTLEEHRVGRITVGNNISLGQARMDVGLSLRYGFEASGDALLVTGETELSSIGPDGIAKIAADGAALVAPGKPVVITSVDDPTGKRHVQVTVTATKLR